MKNILLLILFLCSCFTTYARKTLYSKLADSTTISLTQNTVDKFVNDSTFDVNLLKPIFDKAKALKATNTEVMFLNIYVKECTRKYKSMFYEGKARQNEQILTFVKNKSQALIALVINNYAVTSSKSLVKLPLACDKQLSIIQASKKNPNLNNQPKELNSSDDLEDDDDQTENFKMIIKEQREQIEYLKKRLEECENK